MTCLPRTLQNGAPCTVWRPLPGTESQFKLCKVVKTWCLLLLSFLFLKRRAVWSHKLRIIHTLSNRARWYMVGWLEHDMLEGRKKNPFAFRGICFGKCLCFMPFPSCREVLPESQPLICSHPFVFHPLDLSTSGRQGKNILKKTRVPAKWEWGWWRTTCPLLQPGCVLLSHTSNKDADTIYFELVPSKMPGKFILGGTLTVKWDLWP